MRWLLAVVVVVAVAAVLVVGPFSGGADDLGRFDDDELVAEAQDICARTLQDLPPRASGGATTTDQADTIDEAASVYEGLAAELGRLPAEGDDRRVLADWVATWDTYTSIGRRYAEAIRTEDPRRQEIGSEGDEPVSVLTSFAEDNGFPACAP